MIFENFSILVYVLVGAFVLFDSFVELGRVFNMKNKDKFTGWMPVCGHWTYVFKGRVLKVIAHYGADDEGVLVCVPYQYNVRRDVWYPAHVSLSAYSKAYERGNISLVSLDSLSPDEQIIALGMGDV